MGYKVVFLKEIELTQMANDLNTLTTHERLCALNQLWFIDIVSSCDKKQEMQVLASHGL